MRSRRDHVLLAVLAALILLLAGIADSRKTEGEGDPRPSTFLSGERGARALRLVLEEAGLPTRQRLTPLADADSISGPLAMLAPTREPTPAELRRLAAWVHGGGTLLYVAREGDPTLDTLGLALRSLAPDSLSGFEELMWEGATATATDAPLAAGTATVQGFRRAFADTSRALAGGRFTSLLTSGGRPVALLLPLGKGRVVAWSDPAPFVNESLRASGAAPLFVRAAAGGREGRRPVVFDEYHHGFAGGGSAVRGTLRFLARDRLGRVALQLALAGVGLLLLAGRRFGAPLPPPPARRRSPLEHVEALAGAYRQGGARKTARRLLLAGLARRLGRRQTPAGGEEELVRSLAHRLPVQSEAARRREEEWQKGDRADLVALARDIDHLLEEVRSP